MLNQLLYQTCQYAYRLLLTPLLEIAIYECNTNLAVLNTAVLARVNLPVSLEIFDEGGCEESFPHSRIALTEESFLASLEPCLKLRRIEKPLASSCLPPTDKVVLLVGVVDWREPVGNDLTLLIFFVPY